MTHIENVEVLLTREEELVDGLTHLMTSADTMFNLMTKQLGETIDKHNELGRQFIKNPLSVRLKIIADQKELGQKNLQHSKAISAKMKKLAEYLGSLKDNYSRALRNV